LARDDLMFTAIFAAALRSDDSWDDAPFADASAQNSAHLRCPERAALCSGDLLRRLHQPRRPPLARIRDEASAARPLRKAAGASPREPAKPGRTMTVERGALLRFMTLYAALFSAFGFASPFLPAFLAERGLGFEELGFVLGASTALRLVCGPVAGHLADRIQAFRAELAVCAIVAATAAFLYLAAHGFWTVMAVSLLQAAALAPLVPLADALSLAHARPRQNTRGFEYGRVRGVGSAAFVAGTLLAGQAVGGYGLSAIMWLSATALLTIPIAAPFVPPFPENTARDKPNGEISRRPWLTLLRQRAFVRVTLIAALVLGSHAMYDTFAVIRWTQAGISPATVGVLWAESVAAEVLVFLFLGPRLLRVVTPTAALAVAASSGLMRWAVMGQTADVAALGLVQPLHGHNGHVPGFVDHPSEQFYTDCRS